MLVNVNISKIKTRRGTDSERLGLSYDQGELITTTDTQRLFLGDSNTLGGIPIGAKIHNPITNYYILSTVNAQKGDLINVNNVFYQLTAYPFSNVNNWANVGARYDSRFFNLNSKNNLTLKQNAISAICLKNDTISGGLIVNSGILQINLDNTTLGLSSNTLYIKDSGINQYKIASTSFGNGISGGNGETIELMTNPEQFYYDSGYLTLSSSLLSTYFTDLQPDWFGYGLSYDSLSSRITIDPNFFSTGTVYNSATETLSTVLADVDNISIVKNNSGVISLSTNPALSGYTSMNDITIDKYGKIVGKQPTITDFITGNSALSSFNNTNSLSAIYNGDYLGLSGLQITKFTALSSDGTTVLTLSSAGFITFQSQTSRNNKNITRFAIPIYIY